MSNRWEFRLAYQSPIPGNENNFHGFGPRYGSRAEAKQLAPEVNSVRVRQHKKPATHVMRVPKLPSDAHGGYDPDHVRGDYMRDRHAPPRKTYPL